VCRSWRDSGPNLSLSIHTWPPLELSTFFGIQQSGLSRMAVFGSLPANSGTP
jgi:hypothetical protein